MKAAFLALLLLATVCVGLRIEDWQGRYIVKFKEECRSKGLKTTIESALAGEESLFLEHVNAYIVRTPKVKIGEAIETVSVETGLLKDCIAGIEEDRLITLEETTVKNQTELVIDPETNTAAVTPEFDFYYAWHLDRINARQGLDNNSSPPFSTTNESDVYIIDSGIDRQHIWLSSKVAPYDSDHYVAFTDTDTCGFYACDSNGHGTHVSGLVASDLYGYNPNATLHAVKVFDQTGRTSTSVILNGINWTISDSSSKPVATANLSLGGGYTSTLNSGVASLITNEIHTTVAAGNETQDACTKSPASEPSVLTIGATDQNDAIAYFSNYGSCVDFFAPGLDIISTLPNNYVGVLSGTSMASPIVAGFVSAVAASQSSYYKDTTAVQSAVIDLLTTDVVTGTTINNDLVYTGYSVSNATETETVEPQSVEAEIVIEPVATPEVSQDSSSNFFCYSFIAICLAAVGLVGYKKVSFGKKDTLLNERYGKMV